MISRYLPDSPCTEELFQNTRLSCENNLKESGYKFEIKYKQTEKFNNRSKQRKDNTV